jgi:hypothetical protein
MKTCKRCFELKPVTEFCKNKRSKDGLYSYCRPCSNDKTKAFYSQLSDEKKDEYNHRGNLKKKFGISPQDYSAMLSKQDGVCAVCKKPDSEGKRLAVDHCHNTGKIRGLLCGHCNTGLGKFFDNITYLTDAINYLNDHQ